MSVSENTARSISSSPTKDKKTITSVSPFEISFPSLGTSVSPSPSRSSSQQRIDHAEEPTPLPSSFLLPIENIERGSPSSTKFSQSDVRSEEEKRHRVRSGEREGSHHRHHHHRSGSRSHSHSGHHHAHRSRHARETPRYFNKNKKEKESNAPLSSESVDSTRQKGFVSAHAHASAGREKERREEEEWESLQAELNGLYRHIKHDIQALHRKVDEEEKVMHSMGEHQSKNRETSSRSSHSHSHSRSHSRSRSHDSHRRRDREEGEKANERSRSGIRQRHPNEQLDGIHGFKTAGSSAKEQMVALQSSMRALQSASRQVKKMKLARKKREAELEEQRQAQKEEALRAEKRESALILTQAQQLLVVEAEERELRKQLRQDGRRTSRNLLQMQSLMWGLRQKLQEAEETNEIADEAASQEWIFSLRNCEEDMYEYGKKMQRWDEKLLVASRNAEEKQQKQWEKKMFHAYQEEERQMQKKIDMLYGLNSSKGKKTKQQQKEKKSAPSYSVSSPPAPPFAVHPNISPLPNSSDTIPAVFPYSSYPMGVLGMPESRPAPPPGAMPTASGGPPPLPFPLGTPYAAGYGLSPLSFPPSVMPTKDDRNAAPTASPTSFPPLCISPSAYGWPMTGADSGDATHPHRPLPPSPSTHHHQTKKAKPSGVSSSSLSSLSAVSADSSAGSVHTSSTSFSSMDSTSMDSCSSSSGMDVVATTKRRRHDMERKKRKHRERQEENHTKKNRRGPHSHRGKPPSYPHGKPVGTPEDAAHAPPSPPPRQYPPSLPSSAPPCFPPISSAHTTVTTVANPFPLMPYGWREFPPPPPVSPANGATAPLQSGGWGWGELPSKGVTSPDLPSPYSTHPHPHPLPHTAASLPTFPSNGLFHPSSLLGQHLLSTDPASPFAAVSSSFTEGVQPTMGMAVPTGTPSPMARMAPPLPPLPSSHTVHSAPLPPLPPPPTHSGRGGGSAGIEIHLPYPEEAMNTDINSSNILSSTMNFPSSLPYNFHAKLNAASQKKLLADEDALRSSLWKLSMGVEETEIGSSVQGPPGFSYYFPVPKVVPTELLEPPFPSTRTPQASRGRETPLQDDKRTSMVGEEARQKTVPPSSSSPPVTSASTLLSYLREHPPVLHGRGSQGGGGLSSHRTIPSRHPTSSSMAVGSEKRSAHSFPSSPGTPSTSSSRPPQSRRNGRPSNASAARSSSVGRETFTTGADHSGVCGAGEEQISYMANLLKDVSTVQCELQAAKEHSAGMEKKLNDTLEVVGMERDHFYTLLEEEKEAQRREEARPPTSRPLSGSSA